MSNCMKRKGITLVHYIDDFWVYGDTFASCQKAQIELIVCLGRLGFNISWKKCTSPSQQCTYLGLEFDSANMTISLPKEKVQSLYKELTFFKEKNRATKRQIKRLAGVLSHCSRVVGGGRTFSRRILDLLIGLPEGNPRIYLKQEFMLNLRWWMSWAAMFNGSCTLIRYNYGQGEYICLDSSSKGFGVTYDGDWIAGYFNSHLFPIDVYSLNHNHHWCNIDVELTASGNINVLELIPILVAACYYGQVWRTNILYVFQIIPKQFQCLIRESVLTK